ncbi:MAG: hypothetical protein GXO69_11350 [Acidobacteria bacterium]|nr:hypothetical protein [Acidobacteriota bacterium]
MNIKGYEKALELLGKEKFREARNAFEKLVAKAENSQFREKCNAHIRYCDEKSKEKEAVKNVDPVARAVFLLNRKEFEESIATLQPVLKKDPQNDVLIFILAAAHAGMGDEEKAITLLKKAVSLNPANKLHAQRDVLFENLQEKLAEL